jgi:hypothetical protein
MRHQAGNGRGHNQLETAAEPQQDMRLDPAEAEDEITHLADPINVPMPISRRILDAYLKDYYGRDKSLYLELPLRCLDRKPLHGCLVSGAKQGRILNRGGSPQHFGIQRLDFLRFSSSSPQVSSRITSQ